MGIVAQIKGAILSASQNAWVAAGLMAVPDGADIMPVVDPATVGYLVKQLADGSLEDTGMEAGSVSAGGAVGVGSSAGNGGGLGWNAATNDGGSIGKTSFSSNGGAIGRLAKTSDGFAGGADAQCISGGGAIDAIQLGTGLNSEVGTLQVYTIQLLDAVGRMVAIDRAKTVTASITGATYTLDHAAGRMFVLTLGNSPTITLALTGSPTDGDSFVARIIQDGTGSRIVTWANVDWGTAGAPTLQTAAAAHDYVTFIYNSTTTLWDAIHGGAWT